MFIHWIHFKLIHVPMFMYTWISLQKVGWKPQEVDCNYYQYHMFHSNKFLVQQHGLYIIDIIIYIRSIGLIKKENYYGTIILDVLFRCLYLYRPGKDELVVDKDAKHLLVMRNGNFYVFDVLDSKGNFYQNFFLKNNFLSFLLIFKLM